MEELDEIDAFTAKFEDNNIEVIWGIATDESLGEEVKITILATGFGVSNIPGMDKTIHLNREEEKSNEETPEERVERVQQETKDKEMITKYYGDPALVSKRNFHVFTFEGNDLFNDDLIDAIDSLPTYARSKQDLNDIECKRK